MSSFGPFQKGKDVTRYFVDEDADVYSEVTRIDEEGNSHRFINWVKDFLTAERAQEWCDECNKGQVQENR
jgi:hypothetical protein